MKTRSTQICIASGGPFGSLGTRDRCTALLPESLYGVVGAELVPANPSWYNVHVAATGFTMLYAQVRRKSV